MTQPLQLDLVNTSPGLATLHATLDETISALSTFDADRLEALEAQVGALTAEYVARSMDGDLEAMPELLRKHALLGEMLNATAANLRVVSAVLQAKQTATQVRSNLASWPR